MSFDVYFQGFQDGDAAPADGGGARARELLAPHVVHEDDGMLTVVYGDGEATVYFGDDGMMANHVSEKDPWDLLVRCAHATGWVIMPVGCPMCITSEDQRRHLPEGFAEDAVVVETGADLVRVITTS